MDDINLLQQENAKLNARLTKAVEVFKEQKANIEKLTKENEELKDQINRTPQEEVVTAEKWNNLVTEKENLEKIIDSKDKAYKILQDTYNEVFAENVKLKNELNEISSNNANNENIAIESKEKISELENEITNLKKTIYINTQETKQIVEDYENKITRLEEDNIKLSESSNLLDEANKEINQLKQEYDSLNSTLSTVQNDNLTYKEKQSQLESINSELESTVKFLKEKMFENDKIVESYELENDKHIGEISELKDELENVKRTCNDFENQKLALDCDYSELEAKYKELQGKYISLENEKDIYSNSDDALKEIIDVINKYGYQASKEITVAKENVMTTRIGSDKEFGQNVGV